MLLSYIYPLQILLLVLELQLFITKLFPQTLLLFIQMQEHLNIPIELCLLLRLDDPVHLLLSGDFLLFVLQLHQVFFSDFNAIGILQHTELLSLLPDMILHSSLHFSHILLVNFPHVHEAKTLHGTVLRTNRVLHFESSCQLNVLLIHSSFFIIIQDG